MTTRNFFTKATRAKAIKAARPPKPKRPVHKGTVMVRLANGKLVIMAANKAAQLLGAIKGGRKRSTKRPTWTSTQAQAASRKVWSSRWRLSTRTARRMGRPVKNKTHIDRKALRQQYALASVRGIQYSPALNVWTCTDEKETYCLSERAALQRLGHLPNRNGDYLPLEIVSIAGGPPPHK